MKNNATSPAWLKHRIISILDIPFSRKEEFSIEITDDGVQIDLSNALFEEFKIDKKQKMIEELGVKIGVKIEVKTESKITIECTP